MERTKLTVCKCEFLYDASACRFFLALQKLKKSCFFYFSFYINICRNDLVLFWCNIKHNILFFSYKYFVETRTIGKNMYIIYIFFPSCSSCIVLL